MKLSPVRGPKRKRNIHQERDVLSSRSSLPKSERNGALGEGKKDILEGAVHVCVCAQLSKSARRDQATSRKQQKAVADAGGVSNLVDREKEGALGREIPA